MPNINKIKLSGTSYDIQDLNAPSVSSVTQAQYDALPESAKTSNTLFVITDAEAGDLSQYWTSAQTNSAITQAVSGKANSSDVYLKSETSGATEISTALGGKQDTLSAGTGIDITSNVISVTGGTGGKAIEAGRGIAITTGETADTVSFDLPISATTNGSILIGVSCSANKNKSFVGGQGSVGQGEGSFAFGQYCKAGQWSIAVGNGVEANISPNSAAFGKYNKQNGGFYESDSATTLFSVGNGNGASASARHNAFEIRKNGDIYLNDGTNDVKLQDTIAATAANTTALGGLSLVKLTQAEYDALATKDNSTLYVIVN